MALIMRILTNYRTKALGIGLLGILFVAAQAQAQFFPGGGGFGGGGQGRRSSTSSSRTYSSKGTVGDAVISIDPETRNLIVIADDETAAYIQQVVSNLDAPKPQVLIKVVFLEVSRKDGSDIGIEGTYNKNGNWSGGITNLSGGNIFGLGNSGYAPIPPGAGLYQVFAQDYQVTLRAIATAGKVKVLSKPSVIARNNQPATINVGQSVPLVTNVRFDNFGNAINSVTYQDVGIILRVTPFITSDGFVEMIISPETSELEQDRSQWVPISSSPQGGTISAPIINTRAADTVVVTPDGQTVIIGGMMANAKGESVYKIPYLGDIPMLGALFRRTTKTDTKTELMIFLTPHIIAAPTQLAGMTEVEAGKYDAPKTLEEKQIQKFLEGLPMKEQPADQTPNGKNSKAKSKNDSSSQFQDYP